MASTGSFYVLKSPKAKTGWRLLKETYNNGERQQKTVPQTVWHSLGFSDSMTLDQARARAKQLNGENTIRRQEQASIARIAQRLERDRLHHSVFVPEDLNLQFLKWLDDNVSGSEKHRDKIRFEWATSKKIIITLKLTTSELAANKVKIYRYLASQEYSLDYSKKLIRLMNLYGKFISRINGKFFEEIPHPKSHDREMITDAYLDSDSYYGPSDPLTPDILTEVKTNLIEAQYRWLYCTVWLGLRPSELDQIINDKQNKFWRIEDGETDVLWVYQPKLKSKQRDLRWKPIPLIYPEQETAKSYLFSELQKPIAKTMRKHFPGHITLYGGRKGFTDLMLDRGQDLENIAQWLGHSSIEMTWTHYKNKKRVHFKSAK